MNDYFEANNVSFGSHPSFFFLDFGSNQSYTGRKDSQGFVLLRRQFLLLLNGESALKESALLNSLAM
jgi:hypothetical protein